MNVDEHALIVGSLIGLSAATVGLIGFAAWWLRWLRT